MYIATVYETDNSILLSYTVALYIGYNSQVLQKDIINEDIIPTVLISSLEWFSRPCTTKLVIPRYVTLTLLSGDILQIAYPFKPGTPNWFTFWGQLQSPEIVAVKGIGERLTDKFLRNSLGIP